MSKVRLSVNLQLQRWNSVRFRSTAVDKSAWHRNPNQMQCLPPQSHTPEDFSQMKATVEVIVSPETTQDTSSHSLRSEACTKLYVMCFLLQESFTASDSSQICGKLLKYLTDFFTESSGKLLKCLDDIYWKKHFYPRDAMLARVFATATCLSVCLDVRLSHAGIVPSRVKAGSWNVHHLIATSL